jgi:hypothetical protein
MKLLQALFHATAIVFMLVAIWGFLVLPNALVIL